MLKKENRLTSKEILLLQKNASKYVDNPVISIKFQHNEQKIKMGVLITKKVFKKAFLRNKIKRRIKASFLQINNKPNGLYLIKVKNNEIANMKFHEITSLLSDLISKIYSI